MLAELWQKIALLNENKLILSKLNKYFYSIIHQLDHEIYKSIDLNNSPKLVNNIRIYSTFLAMDRKDLIDFYINRVSHIRSLTTCVNSNNDDIRYLTNLTKLILNGSYEEEYDISQLINLEYLSCRRVAIDFTQMSNLRTLVYSHNNYFIEGQEFIKLVNLTKLDLLRTQTYNLNPKHLLNLIKLKISDLGTPDLNILTKLPKLKELTLHAHRNQRQFLLNFKVDRLVLLTNRPHYYQGISHITKIKSDF